MGATRLESARPGGQRPANRRPTVQVTNGVLQKYQGILEDTWSYRISYYERQELGYYDVLPVLPPKALAVLL